VKRREENDNPSRWEQEEQRRQEDSEDDRWLVRLFALCMLVSICWAISKGWLW
jgi:hypothetical protein